MEFPDILIQQLLKNSSNQIRFTVLHEKNINTSKNPNFNSLDFLKVYTKILEKYKYLDSNMILDESKLQDEVDLDETLKIKSQFPPENALTSKFIKKEKTSKTNNFSTAKTLNKKK